jgi:hypothetical protein
VCYRYISLIWLDKGVCTRHHSSLQFLGFTTALCSESDGGSTSKVLMFMLYWSEKIIRNSMYLPSNTRLIHKTNNRLTLTTVFGFRVDPPSLLWRHMKPKNWTKYYKHINHVIMFSCFWDKQNFNKCEVRTALNKIKHVHKEAKKAQSSKRSKA